MSSPARKLLRASTVIFLFTILGFILEYGVRAVLANTFGDSESMDAFLLATAIPVWIVTVLITTFHKSYIPLYTELRVSQNDDSRHRLTSNIVNIFSAGLSLVVIVAIVSAWIVVPWVLPHRSPEFQNLVREILQIVLPFIAFSGVMSIGLSVLYAQKKFFVASFSIFLQKLLYFVLLLALSSGLGIFAPAYAMTLSGLAALIVVLGYLTVTRKLRYSPALSLTDIHTRKFFRLFLPLIIGALIYKSVTVIDQYMAAWLETGSVTYIALSRLVIMVPIGLVGTTIATALFPDLSEASANRNLNSLRSSILLGVRLAVFAILPIMIVIGFANQPIIQLLFQHGEFSLSASTATAQALLFNLGFLFGATVGALLSNTLYALQKMKTVVAIGSIGAIANIIANLLLIPSLGYLGVALGASIGSLLTAALFVIVIRKIITGWKARDFLPFGKMLVAALLSAGLTWWLKQYFQEVAVLGQIIWISLVTASTYLAASYLLRVNELTGIIKVILKREKRTPSQPQS
ncbi:MAG: lipid II flippase MurJ [bacterium]|nr:lipid II flippase MurJ [bacterium]